MSTSLDIKLSKAVSSANLTDEQFLLFDLASDVYSRNGAKTAVSCGAPVFGEMPLLDKLLDVLMLTHCDLFGIVN